MISVEYHRISIFRIGYDLYSGDIFYPYLDWINYLKINLFSTQVRSRWVGRDRVRRILRNAREPAQHPEPRGPVPGQGDPVLDGDRPGPERRGRLPRILRLVFDYVCSDSELERVSSNF